MFFLLTWKAMWFLLGTTIYSLPSKLHNPFVKMEERREEGWLPHVAVYWEWCASCGFIKVEHTQDLVVVYWYDLSVYVRRTTDQNSAKSRILCTRRVVRRVRTLFVLPLGGARNIRIPHGCSNIYMVPHPMMTPAYLSRMLGLSHWWACEGPVDIQLPLRYFFNCLSFAQTMYWLLTSMSIQTSFISISILVWFFCNSVWVRHPQQDQNSSGIQTTLHRLLWLAVPTVQSCNYIS